MSNNVSVSITVRDGDNELTISRERMTEWPGYPDIDPRVLLQEVHQEVQNSLHDLIEFGNMKPVPFPEPNTIDVPIPPLDHLSD